MEQSDTLILLSLLLVGGVSPYQVTIYNQYLAQGGRVHFEDDRWDGHNGLDVPHLIPKCKNIGTESARWQNRDVNIFPHVQQDHNHWGYPDPNHFTSDPGLCNKFVDNLNQYNHFSGQNTDMIMVIKDLYWPSWLDTSNHGGKFPNNIDAGAEFIVLLLQAINKCSHGKMPAYFEVMNEPDAFWQNVDWDTVIDFHKLVAQKVKAKFPHMYVGGPTKTSIISVANKNNFQFWQLDERFLNMSVDHLDFYSFHPYNDFYVEGNNYRWEGINEARLVGYIDMVENHANLRKGHGIELIISEFGVGSIHGIDQNKPSPLIDWAHAYQHNAHMFTYQGFRDVINRAVGFLLANEQYLGQESLHYSLFNHDGSERHAAKAYRFWHHLKYNYKYLRIDSPFDNKERHISPVALVNPDDGTVAILLHNYDTNWITVNLKFPNNWMRVGSGKETCMYLNSQKIPVLDEEKNMNSQNNNLYMRPESSCIFKFHANQNWGGLKQLQEKIYYGQNTKMGIKRDCQICIFSCQGCEYSVQTRVNVGSTSNLQYAKLRVAVTRDGRTGGNLTPKAVTLNGHQLSNHYQLFLPGRGHEDSRWEVFVYNVPTSFVHQGGNTVKLAFYQDGGHVSTAAIITGG